ncbi:MAG: prepilin-type N-terminal cleavage/methylation domain-containing protein [Pseudomonadota bacterium]
MKKIRKLKIRFISNKLERGFSLVEVMLASLILSVSLLGLVQGQLLSLRTSEHAYFINLADLKNNALAERLRSCSNQLPCIQEQLNIWKEEIKKIFPGVVEGSTSQGVDYQSEISWYSLYQQAKPSRSFCLLFRP